MVEGGVAEVAVHDPPLLVVAVLVGQRDQHGALALAQVVPGWFAGRRRVTEDPQHVIAELERLTQRQPVPLVRAVEVAARPGQGGAELQRPQHAVPGALVLDHPPGPRHRPATAGLPQQIQILPTHQLGAHRIEDRPGPDQPLSGQAAAEEHLLRPTQTQLTDQDRRPRTERLPVTVPPRRLVHRGEPPVRRRPPPPDVAAVHDVVVDDRARLEQLQRRRRSHDPVVARHPRSAPGPVSERRPQPLAPRQQLPQRHHQLPHVRAHRRQPHLLPIQETVQLL